MSAVKGSWEAVFGHMGTPDEVGNIWNSLSERQDILEAALRAALSVLSDQAQRRTDWPVAVSHTRAAISAALTWTLRDQSEDRVEPVDVHPFARPFWHDRAR